EDVGIPIAAGLMDGPVVFDKGGEVVPGTPNRMHGLLQGGWTEHGEDAVERLLPDDAEQELSPRREHHPFDLADLRTGADQDFVSDDPRGTAWRTPLFHEQ